MISRGPVNDPGTETHGVRFSRGNPRGTDKGKRFGAAQAEKLIHAAGKKRPPVLASRILAPPQLIPVPFRG